MHLLSRLSVRGVRDEKMLEKLATHQVETVTTLFALADKCARAAEGRAWHSAPQGGPIQIGDSSVASPGSGKKKNKKNRGMSKLLQAGFIEEVHHPVWLANSVVVPKANGKLRMCINYTNLNKACPKDPYPLPRID
jgi:hypothetical protein